MNRRVALIACLAAAALLAITTVSRSKDAPSAAPSADEQAQMMKAWMELAKPGQPHQKLAAFAGEWDVTTKMFMGGPDGRVEESKGKATIRSVLGGRFIEEHVEGQMDIPDETGKPRPTKFDGMGLTGYDNYKKAYVGTWADSMGTVLLSYQGTDNPAKPDELTFYGEMAEPGLGLQGRLIKYHRKIVSKDKWVFTMYDLARGDDFKAMEITYVRRGQVREPQK